MYILPQKNIWQEPNNQFMNQVTISYKYGISKYKE